MTFTTKLEVKLDMNEMLVEELCEVLEHEHDEIKEVREVFEP